MHIYIYLCAHTPNNTHPYTHTHIQRDRQTERETSRQTCVYIKGSHGIHVAANNSTTNNVIFFVSGL